MKRKQKTIIFLRELESFLSKSNVGLILFLEIVCGILFTAFALLLFAKLSDSILENQRFLFDSTIMQFIVGLRSSSMTNIMIVLSIIGSTGIIFGSVVILVFLFLTRHWRESVIYSAIVLMGAALNALLKLIIQRPRPGLSPLVTETDFSFPSGHSMDSLIFFLTIAYFTFHFTRNRRVTAAVSVISIILVFLIGVSRVYLGVHYPSDILGGYIAGIIWFVAIILLDRTFIFYNLFKETNAKKITP
ncbi:phosphatase PAP2 family protein [Candidatus Woesebacteria bacterium]|nr:phosphatase PAP2 family protein [Candidatus Woesebacteria bacterium]